MARKILNKSSPGSGTEHGGDDVDYINKYLTGVDQGATDPVDINTITTFRDQKFKLRNPANTFSYTYGTGAITANRTISLPTLTGSDTPVFETHPATLVSKTLPAPTLSSYVDFNEIADPAAPSVNKGRVFFDDTDEKLKIIKSGGTVIDLEGGAGGTDILPLPYNYIIYNDAGTYKAKNGLTGAVHATTSATNVALVLNAILDDVRAAGNPGTVISFRPGTFDIRKTNDPWANYGVNIGEGLQKIIFQGSGMGITHLLCQEAGTNMFIKNDLNVCSDIEFRDLMVDGNLLSNQLLHLGGNLTRALLQNCEFIRGGGATDLQINAAGINDFVVKNCRFTDAVAGGDLFAMNGNRMYIDGCYFRRATTGGGLTCGGFSEVIINNCEWHGYLGYGAISIENNDFHSQNVLINGCQFVDCTAGSMVLTISANAGQTDTTQDYNTLEIANCQIENSGHININKFVHALNIHDNIWRTLPGGTAATAIYIGSNCREINIHDNIIKDSPGTSGVIQVDNVAGGSVVTNMMNIHDNILWGIAGRGIAIRGLKNGTIHNNRFYDVGRATNDGYPALYLNNADAGASVKDRIDIYHNSFNVSQQSNKLFACIQIDSDATNINIFDNIMPTTAWQSNAIANSAGANCVIRRNVGYVTEKEGGTSVADGGTINHGLAATPTVVTLTPSLANTILGLTASSSTTFTVSVKTDAGAAGTTQTVFWRASI